MRSKADLEIAHTAGWISLSYPLQMPPHEDLEMQAAYERGRHDRQKYDAECGCDFTPIDAGDEGAQYTLADRCNQLIYETTPFYEGADVDQAEYDLSRQHRGFGSKA
jgi:hypothetical protein